MQKGTTGSGQPDAPDFFHSSATQALVDGVMLAIDREERFALPTSFAGDEFSCGNQTFLICQAYALTRPHSFIRSFEARDPDNCAHYKIHFRMRGYLDISGRTVSHFDVTDANGLQPRSEVRGMGFGSY